MIYIRAARETFERPENGNTGKIRNDENIADELTKI